MFYSSVLGWEFTEEEWEAFWERVECFQFSTALLQQYFFQGRRNKAPQPRELQVRNPTAVWNVWLLWNTSFTCLVVDLVFSHEQRTYVILPTFLITVAMIYRLLWGVYASKKGLFYAGWEWMLGAMLSARISALCCRHGLSSRHREEPTEEPIEEPT